LKYSKPCKGEIFVALGIAQGDNMKTKIVLAVFLPRKNGDKTN